ncbi:hypothetical protein [Hoeflea alexandrii]|jgi:hypothetical protein|uniref:GIY-YIG nuclease family protein n=1 Tax=Hoeflea alexandrii TaxID=288436 RepID=A0ABT1CMG3_9HYPH|nr:hypothetical protein [Hoeflea alexandrii]MCO6407403.1 hypothetical protein [Hoeflea alexandrii]MCY0154197.1 hypothetical protein [Hoeflea alexandrii]
MAQKHLMIAINWYGPYFSVEEASKAAKEDYGYGLYMGIGKQPYERDSNLQYVGISESLGSRIGSAHHKLFNITRDFQLWMGEPATAEPSGPKMKVTRATLDNAEWLHSYFLDLPLNANKKSLPKRSVSVLNRWWKTDYVTPRKRRPHSEWPDLIDFPYSDELDARCVWFGSPGRQIKFSAPEYE